MDYKLLQFEQAAINFSDISVDYKLLQFEQAVINFGEISFQI